MKIDTDKLIAALKEEPRVRHTEQQVIDLILSLSSSTEDRGEDELHEAFVTAIRIKNDDVYAHLQEAFQWFKQNVYGNPPLADKKEGGVKDFKCASCGFECDSMEGLGWHKIECKKIFKPIPQRLTIEEAKDQVARKHGFDDWLEMMNLVLIEIPLPVDEKAIELISKYINEAMELYKQNKV